MPAFRRSLIAFSIATALAACTQTGEPESREGAAPELSRQSPASGQPGRHQPATARPMEADAMMKLEEREAANTARLARQDLAFAAPAPHAWTGPASDRESYANFEDNGVVLVSRQPVSTFSIDVDTGAYSNVRRFLNGGRLPPRDAVRTEELVNYFSYDYALDDAGDAPFSINTELGRSPWNAGRHLLQVGVRALEPGGPDLPASNLVFLVDVSGSMNSPDKLDLLRTSLKLLAGQLDSEDRIAIVVYAGASGVVLEPTAGDDSGAIALALDRLQAGGSTNGAAGIELAYHLARQSFIEGGINRILLATDGDFNVGMTDFDALKDLVAAERESGIGLTTLGFGTGNYNDQLMEQLADAGNGNHAYIDTLNEARKVLVDEMSATLQTVAWDVKIQLEFNPALVSEYRLVGYENRVLDNADFNNDRVDAGEIGAGHTVTALYELILVDSGNPAVDPLRYGDGKAASGAGDFSGELAFLKLRYKAPGEDRSTLVNRPVLRDEVIDDLADNTDDFRFAVSVAGFSQLLRDNARVGDLDYEQVLALATPARGADPFGYRAEFLNLVRTAQVLEGH